MCSFNAKVCFIFPHYIFQTYTQNSLRLLKRYQCSGKEKQTLISVCFCVNDKFSCVSSSFLTLHFFHLSLNGECWDRNIHEYSADIPVQAPEALRHGVEIDFTVARESGVCLKCAMIKIPSGSIKAPVLHDPSSRSPIYTS